MDHLYAQIALQVYITMLMAVLFAKVVMQGHFQNKDGKIANYAH